ncbi:MAG: GspH/FimT family pseudopilin [Patescibacteria group bacterium]
MKKEGLEVTNGFTLVELIVVTGIILLLSAIALPNFNAGEKNMALERSTVKLVQDLSKAREMAMSAGAYGIKLETNSSSYILFADLNNDQVLDSGEAVETFFMEKGVKISVLSPVSPLIITFTPPDPTVNINSTTTITLTNDNQSKNIRINKAGLINNE